MEYYLFIFSFVVFFMMSMMLWMTYEMRDYISSFLKEYDFLRFKNSFMIAVEDPQVLEQQLLCYSCNNLYYQTYLISGSLIKTNGVSYTTPTSCIQGLFDGTVEVNVGKSIEVNCTS